MELSHKSHLNPRIFKRRRKNKKTSIYINDANKAIFMYRKIIRPRPFNLHFLFEAD